MTALARGVDAASATVADASRVPVVEDGRLLGVPVREPLLRRLAEDEAPGDPEAQQQV